MADERDPQQQTPEEQTQDEIKEQAVQEGDDPQTRREEVELDLMEQGSSEAGEVIGDPID